MLNVHLASHINFIFCHCAEKKRINSSNLKFKKRIRENNKTSGLILSNHINLWKDM